eukprot:3113162-Rhodomonas_salina.1
MSGTVIAYGTVALRACYAMSSTDLAYGAICLQACYTMSGTDLAYGATSYTALINAAKMHGSPRSGSCLRACYAMSGTEIAKLSAYCYAMSGTEIAYGAICLQACYAMSGTELAYAACCLRDVRGCYRPMASPVLTWHNRVRGTNYCEMRCRDTARRNQTCLQYTLYQAHGLSPLILPRRICTDGARGTRCGIVGRTRL